MDSAWGAEAPKAPPLNLPLSMVNVATEKHQKQFIQVKPLFSVVEFSNTVTF